MEQEHPPHVAQLLALIQRDEFRNLVIKGTPFVVAVYLLSPSLTIAWNWLPWLWSMWEIYRKIPAGTFPVVFDFLVGMLQRN